MGGNEDGIASVVVVLPVAVVQPPLGGDGAGKVHDVEDVMSKGMLAGFSGGVVVKVCHQQAVPLGLFAGETGGLQEESINISAIGGVEERRLGNKGLRHRSILDRYSLNYIGWRSLQNSIVQLSPARIFTPFLPDLLGIASIIQRLYAI
jgi:hypothetical protein